MLHRIRLRVKLQHSTNIMSIHVSELPCVLPSVRSHLNYSWGQWLNTRRGVVSTPDTPPCLHGCIQIANVNGGVVATPY